MPTLAEQAAAFAITLTPTQLDQFDAYTRELAEWNERMNLTAITEPGAVQVRHFLDSLSLVRAFKPREGLRLIDVGTGAGFPGLPLKITFPMLDVTLLEATGKKLLFLQHLIDQFQLTGVDTLHARAEDAGHTTGRRAAYDVVTARSVARLPTLLEYLLPLAKLGGRCIAMKGTTAEQEVADSRRALTLLGGRVQHIMPVELPDVPDKHYLIVIEKVTHTPSAYPRKAGLPAKEPLG